MSDVTIRVNDREVTAEFGQTLLRIIMDADIPIDTACGGQARCHLCRVTITEGRDQLPKANPIEYKALGNVLIAQGMRLACQVEVTQPMTVTVPEPRPKRRRGPPSRPPSPSAGDSRREERRRPAAGGERKPAEAQRPRDHAPRQAVSKEEPSNKKRRRRRRPRRRKKPEGS